MAQNEREESRLLCSKSARPADVTKHRNRHRASGNRPQDVLKSARISIVFVDKRPPVTLTSLDNLAKSPQFVQALPLILSDQPWSI